MLVDGTFLTHALQQKIHVKEQLPKMLEGRTTPMVTGCVLAELRSLGDRALGAAIIAKGYYRVKCGHDDAPISASRCICEQISTTNERRFLVATQDPELCLQLRKVPGVPLIRLKGQVPLLEEPSTSSCTSAEVSEAKKLRPSDWEKAKLPELRAKELQAKALAEQPAKKRKRKGVNPLACKKKKPKGTEVAASKAIEQVAPKAKRVRSRKMGTRTRAEAEAMLGKAAASDAEPASARPRKDTKADV